MSLLHTRPGKGIICATSAPKFKIVIFETDDEDEIDDENDSSELEGSVQDSGKNDSLTSSWVLNTIMLHKNYRACALLAQEDGNKSTSSEQEINHHWWKHHLNIAKHLICLKDPKSIISRQVLQAIVEPTRKMIQISDDLISENRD